MNNQQYTQFELTNIGAWFSANIDVDTYILTDMDTGRVFGMIKVNNYNYYRALQILIDYIECKYNFIEKVWYENDSFVIKCICNQINNININKFLRLNAIKETDIIDFTKENINGNTLGN